MRRPTEAVLVGAAGGLLAGATGALVGLAVPAAVVGVANGAVSGYRRIYSWHTPSGVGAFVIDSTWALATTSAGVVSHGVAAARGGGGYAAGLSERRNRHVYSGGFTIRKGFATTFGNVVNGAGDVSVKRRAKLVADHEHVHVRQARTFGPLFPVLYGGWMIGGSVGGAMLWALRTRAQGATLSRTMETCAYYMNPFERWAYSRDDHWPPAAMVAGVNPGRPLVSPYPTGQSVHTTA